MFSLVNDEKQLEEVLLNETLLQSLTIFAFDALRQNFKLMYWGIFRRRLVMSTDWREGKTAKVLNLGNMG